MFQVQVGFGPMFAVFFELVTLAAYAVVAYYAWLAFVYVRWPGRFSRAWRLALIAAAVALVAAQQTRKYQQFYALEVAIRRDNEADWEKCLRDPQFRGLDLQRACKNAERDLGMSPAWHALGDVIDANYNAVAAATAGLAVYVIALALLCLGGHWLYHTLAKRERANIADFLNDLYYHAGRGTIFGTSGSGDAAAAVVSASSKS